MRTTRARGAAAAFAVVVVAIVAVAGYVVLSGGSSSRSSSITPSASSASLTASSSTNSTITISTCANTVSSSNVTALSPGMIPLFTAYDSQTMQTLSSAEGEPVNLTESFQVVYRSATTYKVTTNETNTENGTTTTLSGTGWILRNGTVLAAEAPSMGVAGNETGAQADDLFGGLVVSFGEEASLGMNQSLLTGSPFVHLTGTAMVTIGGKGVVVATYALKGADETIVGCGATAVYYLDATSVGTPAGATFPVLSSLNLDASDTTSTGTTTIDFSMRLTAFAVAP